MALIPVDVGLRLRTQPGETDLAGVAAVKEIAADLPPLGQNFTARIQEVLPQNTYLALVGGKTITLALPHGAEAGDVLELVVVDRTPKMVMARLADPAPNATAGASASYPHTTFSPAARMIGDLLPAEGQAPAPALLNGGKPVLAVPPAQAGTTLAAQLAPRLEQAVHESGLFYEAHQAQWLTGKVTTEALRAEPQNRYVDHAAPASVANLKSGELPTGKAAAIAVAASATETSVAANGTASTASGAVRGSGDTASATVAPAASGPPTVAEALRPLVQQQLDAASTQRLMWHGEVWPNQTMEWEVRREARQAAVDVDADAWNTRLGLTMPQLGHVDARLSLDGNRLRLVLQAGSEASAAPLKARLPELESALAAAGLRLDAAQVRTEAAATAEFKADDYGSE